jgi:hypothetical protein
MAAGSSGDRPLPRPPRSARGSSPPPIPASAKLAEPPSAGAAKPHANIEARPGFRDEDDTEFAPPPHAAEIGAQVVAAGPVGNPDDPTALLESEPSAALAAAASASSSHPIVDIPVRSARRGRGRKGRIRRRVAIPRRNGPLGDGRYVFAALRGLARARKALAQARRQVERDRAAREGELLAVARRAVAALEVDVELVSRAQERLTRIEDRRAQGAGRIAAADEELAAIERRRAAELDELRGRRRRLDAQLASVRERLGPLSSRGASALRRAAELEVDAEAVERRIAMAERKLYWIRGPQLATMVEAGLRDHRAELEAIQRDQLEVAAELDDVEPAIASLQSARADLCAKLEELDRAEAELDVRAAERIEAVRAARRVEERVVAEADRERDEALRDLAERVAAERPPELVADLARLDDCELAIATSEREIFEQSELCASIDRRAIARGIGLITVCAAVLLTAGIWIL